MNDRSSRANTGARFLVLAAVGPCWLGSSGCARPLKTPCEFSVNVRVVPGPQADDECRARGARFTDSGLAVGNTTWVKGCAVKGLIVTDGTESNAGHELMHHIERNCGQTSAAKPEPALSFR